MRVALLRPCHGCGLLAALTWTAYCPHCTHSDTRCERCGGETTARGHVEIHLDACGYATHSRGKHQGGRK
jgi:hypothetical protein